LDAVAFLDDGPRDAPHTLVLAHGSGAPMDSPFMQGVATGLAAHGHRVLRFEFPYMHERRRTGRPRPPDRAPVLIAAWRAAIAAAGPAGGLVIGGKSLGGRIASLIADDASVAGLVCLGYPFHPPGKKEDRSRLPHLATLATPTLIVQGTRDPFGTPAEVADVPLSPKIRLHWVADGDHGLRTTQASGRSAADALAEAVAAIDRFLATL